jgi:uncharacterized protein (DUF1501 family)
VDSVTRRRFLIASGVTAGAALAGGATAVTVGQLLDAGRRDPLPSGARILVLVTLYGGNDGLNTVVPATDPVYRASRPDLAYGEHEVLPLRDGLGLNPAMKGFKALWDAGRLAIVRGVSYPRPDHSHFRSMAIWQTAAPASPAPTGWLGRWLDATGRDPLRAVAVGPVLPPLLAGERVAGAALPLTGIDLPAGYLDPVSQLCHADPGDVGLAARAAGSLGDLLRAETTFGPVLTGSAAPSPAPSSTGGGGGDGGALAAQLDVVARCVTAGAPTRAYSVSLGGFDTHADEKDTQARLLGELDAAVTGFLHRVAAGPAGDRVVLAVYSEFGRRVAANANQGTDHGTAGPVFIAGHPVKGGFYGDEPPLSRLNDGDLFATTDFRDVYATLLHRTLDTDPARVLTAYRPSELPFL